MLLKYCNYAECKNKVPYGVKYCDEHSDEDKKRYIDYKNRRDDKKEQQFYSSKQWRDFREYISKKQFGLDLIEWYKGNVVSAEVYHHIIEIKDNWDLRIDENNLIGLTQENHMKIHKLMDKSDKDKEEVIKMLKEILKKFYKEY